jgi:hypothetical protein
MSSNKKAEIPKRKKDWWERPLGIISLSVVGGLILRNGFYIEVEGLDGYAFIVGSMERHKVRFVQIVDWIRQHIKPLV